MSDHSIVIRRATPGDLDVVAEYNRRLAEETEEMALDMSVLRAGVREALADDRKALYFIAEAHGKPIGQTMVTYEWSDWRNGVIWWIQSVYVEAEWRRRGVFRGLYDHVLQSGRAAGAVGFRLYAVKHNSPALATYERLGMEVSEYIVLERFH